MLLASSSTNRPGRPTVRRLRGRGSPKNGASSVVLTDNITAVNTEYSTPFSVFYINWRPDGKVVGLLGGLNGLTTLALLDVETGTLTQMHGAVSFYFDWSPDGSKMVSHHDTQRIEVFEPETGTRTPVDTETSAFKAAVWLPDGETILYVRPTSTAQIGGLLAAQTAPVGQLVAHNLETDNISVLAEAVGLEQFSLAPDGTKVTYSAVVSATETLVQVVDLESGETQTIDGGFVYVWQWSPDSEKILLITVVDGLLQYKVWDGETVTTYATAFATGSFSGSYLPFWGQYTLSMSLWAPDSTAFVFPARHEGGDWIFLQLIDDDLPILVGPGSIAAFSSCRRVDAWHLETPVTTAFFGTRPAKTFRLTCRIARKSILSFTPRRSQQLLCRTLRFGQCPTRISL